MDTPLTWTLSDCNPHGICNVCNDGFNCTVHLFPVHILYLLCIECLLEEYHNKTMFLGEINLIVMFRSAALSLKIKTVSPVSASLSCNLSILSMLSVDTTENYFVLLLQRAL